MFFKDRTPSLIMSGSKTQCEILALMIERGFEVAKTYHVFIHESCEHPDSVDPIRKCAYHPFMNTNCFYVSAVGYAILGLEGSFESLLKAYQEQLFRAEQTKKSEVKRSYVAAADMLGLPAKLLRDTDFQSFFGMQTIGVIDELRRPQRGYC